MTKQPTTEPTGDGSPATPTPVLAARPTRRPRRILGTALALGLLADVLFYGERLGVSIPLFALALVAGLFALAQVERVRPVRANLWLPAAALFFAAMVALRADPFLTALNLALGLVMLALFASFFAAGHPHRQRLSTLALAPLLTFGYATVRPARLLRSARARGGDGERPRRLLPILRGLLIALPFLIAFGFLLASADLVFEQFMKDLLNFRIPPALLRLLWQALVVVAVAWALAGAFAYALDREEHERPRAKHPPLLSLGPIEAVTVMASVGAMLLLFGWIQFTYLFGGETALAVEGYTYAEYARRGFLELVVVAVVSLGLILVLHRVTRFGRSGQERIFGVLSTLTIALVLVLLASAFERLRLYEEAYGYTRLRLYAHAFVVWLAALLVWLPLTRWMRRLWSGWRLSFGFGVLVTALLFAASLDLLKPDAFIARKNLERFERTGKLDARYLTWLSDDAVPVLVDTLPRLEGRDRALLLEDLRRRRARLERRQEVTGWPSFHLGHHRTRRALQRPLGAQGEGSP